MDLKEKLKLAVTEGNLEETIQLLEAFDLDDGSKICTRAMKAKRMKLEPMTRELQHQLYKLAIRNDRLAIVKLLTSKGLTVNYEDLKSKRPLLQIAVYFGKVAITRELLINGANVNAVHQWRILTAGSNEVRNIRQMTALHIAASKIYENQSTLVKMLLDFGADVNACESDLSTPIHYAVRKSNVQVAKVLLERGACFQRNNFDFSPLDFAAKTGCEKLFELLLDTCLTNQPNFPNLNFLLFHAAKSGHYKNVKLLLERGADGKSTNELGQTAVHYCAATNILNDTDARAMKIILKLFLKHGVDFNARDNKQQTPLHLSAKSGSSNVFRFILDHGSDILAVNQAGKTALDIALMNSSTIAKEKCRLLISRLVRWYSEDPDVCAKCVKTLERHPDLLLFWKDCFKEMQIIKKEKMEDTKVTLYDFMNSQSLTQLGFYARNESIQKVFESVVLNLELPIYCSDLYYAFNTGMFRKELEDKAKRIFHLLLDKNDQYLPRLPEVATTQIISYLKNNDLFNFSR